MSATATDTIVQRLITEVLNQGQVAVVDDLFAPDYRDHHPRPGQGPGREGYKQAITQLRTSFPDLHFTLDDLIAAGDKVVLRLTAQGTHQGEFAGIPPSGQPITVTGIIIVRLAEGQIAERWGLGDDLALLHQVGVITPPGQLV